MYVKIAAFTAERVSGNIGVINQLGKIHEEVGVS